MFSSQKEQIVILFDLNPIAWNYIENQKNVKSLKAEITSINETISNIFSYLTQMMLSDMIYPPAIIGYLQESLCWLFPDSQIAQPSFEGTIITNSPNVVQHYTHTVLNKLLEFIKHISQDKTPPKTNVSAIDKALANALCYLNRSKASFKRVLIFSVSPDDPSLFHSLMNSIFAARHTHITIDSIMISADSSLSSIFLNQAAIITKGIYLEPNHPKYIAQYLYNIPLTSIREITQIPLIKSLDFKVKAIDTNNLVDHGFLCPICLSIFEEQIEKCPRCGNRLIPN